MSGVIYLVHGDGALVPMTEQAYDSEDILQRLLADYPDLLGGEQMTTSAPRRWLLLAREAGLPSEEGGSDRWSIDHLFIDQDGIPTIIEVKRSSDTRIRREVVGQMLDYAANAVVYWPVESLRVRFEQRCELEGRDPETTIAEALHLEGDIEDLWMRVQTNLQAGRVRLVFVADVIPPELRRVVEFLNGQMNPAEVLAVEVRQYVGQGQQALVPRVLGQSQQAVGQKAAGGPTSLTRQWDEPSFLEEIESQFGLATRATVRQIMHHFAEDRVFARFGKGRITGTVHLDAILDQSHPRMFAIYTDGRLEIPLGDLAKVRPFQEQSLRIDLLRRLNTLAGVNLDQSRFSAWPSFHIEVLERGRNLDDFLATADWMLDEVRTANQRVGN